MGPPIECEPLSALMTLHGCQANQDRAERALTLLDEGVSIYLLPHTDLDRLMACGHCPLFTGEGVEGAIGMLRTAVRGLLDMVDLLEWHSEEQEDPQQKRKERRRRFRDSHKEDMVLDRKLRYLTDRYGKEGRDDGEESEPET